MPKGIYDRNKVMKNIIISATPKKKITRNFLNHDKVIRLTEWVKTKNNLTVGGLVDLAKKELPFPVTANNINGVRNRTKLDNLPVPLNQRLANLERDIEKIKTFLGL